MTYENFTRSHTGHGLLFGIQINLSAQSTNTPVELLLESWFESNQSDASEYAPQLEYLEELRDHPLDLNKASIDELKTYFSCGSKTFRHSQSQASLRAFPLRGGTSINSILISRRGKHDLTFYKCKSFGEFPDPCRWLHYKKDMVLCT